MTGLNPTKAYVCGCGLLQQHRIPEARELLSCAVDGCDGNEPWLDHGRIALAHAAAFSGDLGEAWRLFDAVLNGHVPRPERMWDGKTVKDKTILVRQDAKLGDCIQIVRYATALNRLGATVVVECAEQMAELIATVPGVSAVFAFGDSLPQFDYEVPMLLAPMLLGIKTEADIPWYGPYLTPDPTIVNLWRSRLARFDRLKVGVCWAGSLSEAEAEPGSGLMRRSLPFALFEILATIPGVTLFSLQRGRPARDRWQTRMWRTEVVNLELPAGTFMDTASAVSNLDVIVTVDTMLCHLAGALGSRTWTLLPHTPAARWFLDREDSPWYPTMRLFRQPSESDWLTPVERVRDELIRLRDARTAITNNLRLPEVTTAISELSIQP